jgi:hypothetical protein
MGATPKNKRNIVKEKKKDTYSIQCRMQNGNRILVSWIPEDYAVRGKVLNLKDRKTGTWENGWIVLETGQRKPYEFVILDAQDYKAWRDVTDI